MSFEEKVTISLTVFAVESAGPSEGTEEADKLAGDRGADWKAPTGAKKNCLFSVFLLVYLFLVQCCKTWFSWQQA